MNEAAAHFQRRIVVGAVLCVVAFTLVTVRLIDVTLFGDKPRRGPEEVFEFSRADLVDRNGELLARDLPTVDVYARPHALWDRDRAARDLAAATGVDPVRLAHLFAGNQPYVPVARHVTPDAQDRVMRLGLPGLDFQPSSKRYYPDGRAAAQVLGVTKPDGDGEGVSGLEMGLDSRLRGGKPGQAVELSIDMRVQYILAHEAEASREEFSARAAGGVVLDVRTGEVLALVSLPDFDPNLRTFSGDDTTRDIIGQDVYELGSVFKIFTYSMATEDHTIRPDEVFPAGNGYRIGRFTIHEAERMPSALAARDALAQSSNIVAAQIALRSGGDRQRQFLEKLGLLAPLRTELPEARRPMFPAPGHWGQVETATIGFGHGISVSPLAFAAAAASVVNGGRQIVPTFLKHPEDARGGQVISPETSLAMRGLLRYVVTNGTGKKADVPGYFVGGKTGSAQKAGPHGYQHKLVTSFCAVFPIDDPRYLLFVMLDEPHGTRKTFGFALAGYTAAPLAGRVISRIAPILGVPQRVPVARSNT
jgi:cell division protein FtsI (penicillin-binding protein 3)